MKTTFENFDKTLNEYLNAKKEIRNTALDMIKKICERTEDKSISLDKFKNYIYDFNIGYPTISYDGGNNPEYSNLYSTVDGFRIENEIVIFDIEDDPQYDESRVRTEDIIYLCEIIIEYENQGYKLGVNEYGDDEEE